MSYSVTQDAGPPPPAPPPKSGMVYGINQVYTTVCVVSNPTERQWLISGVHSIMMEKSALTGKGGGVRSPPFTLFTVTYKVAVSAPAERIGAFPLFHLYPILLCGQPLGVGGCIFATPENV